MSVAGGRLDVAAAVHLADTGRTLPAPDSRRSLAATIGVGLVRGGGDGGAETSGGLNASLRHASPGKSIVAGLGLVGGGRAYTLGWRMEPALHAAPRFGLGLQVARREHTDDDRETEHAIDLRVTVAW